MNHERPHLRWLPREEDAYVILAHVATGDLATASLQNDLIDDLAVLKTTIDNNGKIAYATAAKSADYGVLTTDDFITVNASGAGRTMTLPTAVGAAGKFYVIKKIDSSANTVTLATTSAQTIDGASTYVMRSQYEAVTVVSDGANWNVI